MDKLKQWVALTVVGALAILAAGWFLLVAPKRSEAADLNDQAAQQQQSNAQLVIKLATLKAQAKDLPAQQAKVAAVAAKIPDNPAEPALIRALSAAAVAAGVELVSIAPSQPAPYLAATTPVAPRPQAAAGTSTTSGAPVATAPTSIPLSQIALSLNVVGGYFQVEQFLDGLENLTRAFKVTGFSLAPGTNPVKAQAVTVGGTAPVAGPSASETGKTLSASITGQVFMMAPIAQPTALVPAPAK